MEQDAVTIKHLGELELLERLQEMAADPNIQHELRTINEEFTVTELDGLNKL